MSDNKGKWIKCSDEKPKPCRVQGDYIIYLCSDGWQVLPCVYHDGEFWFTDSNEEIDTKLEGITHWMPLPKAPEDR